MLFTRHAAPLSRAPASCCHQPSSMLSLYTFALIPGTTDVWRASVDSSSHRISPLSRLGNVAHEAVQLKKTQKPQAQFVSTSKGEAALGRDVAQAASSKAPSSFNRSRRPFMRRQLLQELGQTFDDHAQPDALFTSWPPRLTSSGVGSKVNEFGTLLNHD